MEKLDEMKQQQQRALSEDDEDDEFGKEEVPSKRRGETSFVDDAPGVIITDLESRLEQELLARQELEERCKQLEAKETLLNTPRVNICIWFNYINVLTSPEFHVQQ